MNILILNYEFPPLGGGAGNATENIARNLVMSGYTVTIISTWFKGLPEIESVDGYQIVRVRSWRKRIDRSTLLEKLHYVYLAAKKGKEMVSRHSFDYILAFFALPSGLVAYYLHKKYCIPYIVSLRGGDVPGSSHALTLHHALAAPFTYLVWRRAKTIVANSKGLTSVAQRTGALLGKTVLCIPNGVDTEFFKPRPTRLALHAQTDPLVLLFVGRLDERKGVADLLRAFAEIRNIDGQAYAHMQLHIIGDGPSRAAFEILSRKLQVDDKVSFLGWVQRGLLPDEYQCADLFVFLSLEEGMPNAVLEAMATGLPILATDIPGTNELVEHNSEGVLIQDTTGIAREIVALYKDSATRMVYGERARAKSLRYSWKMVADAYSKLFSI